MKSLLPLIENEDNLTYTMKNPTVFEAHYIRQKLNRLVMECAELADLCTDLHGEDEIILENLRELIILADQTQTEYEKRYFLYES